jgi:signal transduction histidine kinase
MAWLPNLPIKIKLIAMMMITSSATTLLMVLAIAVNEAVTEHGKLEKELETLAQVIGSRSTGALTFNDSRTATENLSALQAKDNIVYAAIFQQDGTLFAYYKPASHSGENQKTDYPELNNSLRQFFTNVFSGTTQISKDILLEGELIGEILIISSLDTFYTSLANYLGWVTVIGVICFGISLLVASRLHHLISNPILNLHEVTNTISDENDYSLRIKENRKDELGLLIISFNHMLEQIQIRDQELARYSNQLETEVADRTHELFEAKQRRIYWLENMARFLKHELKNATVGIKTSLELMERRLQDHTLDVYLIRAGKSLEFMNALLGSVSNASNLEASIYKESLVPLDFSLLVDTQVEEYRSIYPGYTLQKQLDMDVHISGNSIRIKQMLDKLISNAFEHSKENTIILVSVLKNDTHVELSVANEGAKLPEDKDRMFDLFVSLRDDEYQKSDSLGLGLYLVKLIAESHGGWVKAEDLKDKEGAVFTVTFPLNKAKENMANVD